MYYPCSQAGHCKYFLNRLQLLTFNLSHSKLELIFNLFSGISWIYIYCDFKNLVINVNVFVKSVCLAQPKSCYKAKELLHRRSFKAELRQLCLCTYIGPTWSNDSYLIPESIGEVVPGATTVIAGILRSCVTSRLSCMFYIGYKAFADLTRWRRGAMTSQSLLCPINWGSAKRAALYGQE